MIIVVHDERNHISREQRLKSAAISDAVWVPMEARPAEPIFFRFLLYGRSATQRRRPPFSS